MTLIQANELACEICDKKFTFEHTLKEHKLNQHKMTSSAQKNEEVEVEFDDNMDVVGYRRGIQQNMEITENNEKPNKEVNEQKVDGEDQDIEKPHLCLNCHQSFSTFFEKALGHLCRK